jgi:2-keto-4-pentenoate hydratase
VSRGARAQQAARLLIALRGGAARPAALPEALAPRSEAEAYEIQAATAQQLGARIAGWKASMNGPDGGLAAPLYASAIHDAPARVDCPGGDAVGLGVEPEIAFTLGRDMDALPGNQPYGMEQLEDGIASAHPVIEILYSRFASLEAAPPLDRLADNLSNAGLVRGAACPDWRGLALATLPLRLALHRSDGSRFLHETRGGHPCGDPRLPLLWLVNAAIARDAPLRRGDLITTGSCGGLHPVERGTRVRVAFDGLGSAELELR